MKNFLKKLSLLLIPVMIFVFLFLEAGESKAATSTPSPVMSSTTIVVGDHINIKVSNSDADHVSNDIPVSFVGVKEGVAKVTACRQATNCASINITVIKKATPRKVVKKKVTKAKRTTRPAKKLAKIVYAPIAMQDSGVQTQSLVLSRTNLQVREKGSSDIIVQDSSAVSIMTDSSAVSASVVSNPTLHNVKITIYGMALGVANIKICDKNLVCATARVEVTPAAQVAAVPTTASVVASSTVQVAVTPSIANRFSVSEKFLNIQPGETYWLSTTNSTNLSVVSSIWLVPAVVKDNYVVVSVSSYYYGEATLKVCNGQNSNDCELVYVNSKSKPSPLSVSGSKI